jgi:hypothetical protein
MKYNFFNNIGFKEVVFSIVTFVLFLLFLEGALRFYYFVINKSNSSQRIISKYLGWETAPNFQSTNTIKGYGKIKYSTQKDGFRVFGNTVTDKKKIFVIGDSFTEAHTVSDGSTYYETLQKNSNKIEIFAYGSGGYGSLQEYLIIEKYIDVIKPDIILWQFCSNDIVNNDHNLESASFINNNQMTRPYYVAGKIEWLYPRQKQSWISDLIKISYLVRTISIKFNIFKAETEGSIEYRMTPDDPMLKRAINTTSEIMCLVKKKAGKTPVVAFSADNPTWINNCFSDICKKNGIYYIAGIPETIEMEKKGGVVVDGSPYDTHYNGLGHAIIGKIIYDYLVDKCLLDREADKQIKKY